MATYGSRVHVPEAAGAHKLGNDSQVTHSHDRDGDGTTGARELRAGGSTLCQCAAEEASDSAVQCCCSFWRAAIIDCDWWGASREPHVRRAASGGSVGRKPISDVSVCSGDEGQCASATRVPCNEQQAVRLSSGGSCSTWAQRYGHAGRLRVGMSSIAQRPTRPTGQCFELWAPRTHTSLL